MEKNNLSAMAYEKIKTMILQEELKQGQAISISALADALQISRTPVSNACQRLEYEKLLTVLPKQGIIINTITLEAAAEIYELRAAIESYNARRVMDSITLEDIRTLKTSLENQKGHAQRNDAVAFMKEDHFFHKLILAKNRNYEMNAFINQLYDRAFLLGTKNSHSTRLQESIEEHRRILNALERGERQGFADAIEENILNGFRSLTARFI